MPSKAPTKGSPHQTTPRPGFLLSTTASYVGASSHQRQQEGAVLAWSSAGRKQGLAEQHCPGTGTCSSTGTPLPIVAVAGWAASLAHGEGPPVPGGMGQANCCCGSREALSDAEAVLSADVRLTRGRKRSERRLLLLQEDVVVAKLQHGTTLRPQLRLALDQLWVLSGTKQVWGEEEEEAEGSDEGRISLVFIWPTGSCIADFGSQELKELWLGTLLGRAAEASLLTFSRFFFFSLAQWRPFSTRSLERLMERQAKAGQPKGGRVLEEQGHPLGSGRWTWFCGDTRALLLPTASGGSTRRRRALPWPFALRWGPAAAQAPGQAGSGCSRALFGQPLAALCGDDGTLPQPMQELLAVLQQEGPLTEGIFRRAASRKELQELQEALDRGTDVDLASQPALLLAVLLKDFLRSIPAKLLVNDLYEDWVAAMQKSSKEEKLSELKAVADKLPAANLLLLRQLLSLLQHIGRSAATSRMSCSNLAICVGPNLLSPPNEELLPLEAMLEVTEKVRCIEQPAAAFPACQSLAAPRSRDASSLEQMLLVRFPAAGLRARAWCAQVKVLVEFLVENCRELFGEETSDRSCPRAKESPAPAERSRDACLEEPSVPAAAAAAEHQAPPALPPSTLESMAGSLGHPGERASLLEERRFAGSPRDEGNRRKRKRKEAWGEERESCTAKKRSKRGKVPGDGAVKRRRRVQQVRKPRCRFVFRG
ncbi:uncharacterized protein LOC135312390 [Phalacrocorax carbo]|uniref:uncharacterized protein LOC135312390 n=1 Tax=Phalacrocorax carbo TaxID=9209 RepID=UPI0031196FA1